jgi:hypothetical protein
MSLPTRLAAVALLLLAAAPALAQDPPSPPPKGDPPPPAADGATGGKPAAPAPPPEAEPKKDDAADREAADRALLEELVKKAVPIVEKLRGHAFQSPVPVQPVTREQFLERYLKDFTRILGGEERAAPASRLLTRLGILSPGDDLRALIGSFLQGNIAANYDPATKKVSFLPGVNRDLPLMVHELTHALDDQLFDMSAQISTWKGNFDRALAYGALCEGDAESLEFRLRTGGAVAKQPLDDLRRMADAVAANILKGRFGSTPPVIVLAFQSQYTEGLIYAEALRRSEKKNEAVDSAFRTPPASTEHVLHPEKALAAADPPVALVLPAPPETAKLAMATTMGELGTRLVLIARGLPAKEAAEAAAGWGGDTAALVEFPAGEALLWTTVWDTEADATAFYEAMQRCFPLKIGEAAAKPPRMLVQRGTTVEFVEAPLDALPDAVEMIKKAERK